MRLAKLIGLKAVAPDAALERNIECRLFRFDIVAGRPSRAAKTPPIA